MDEIELAQMRQLEEVEHALAARPSALPGRTHCSNLWCEAPISQQRQVLGAQLCLECQEITEHRARQCVRGAI